jgi:glycosyltransferase involved in cell wall biosynthesis
MGPLVSIIMPAFNCEKYIFQAITSILSQTYSNIELIIADDASTDKTRNIINSFSDRRIVKIFNQENIGNIRTTNILFGICKGEFITIQDADDWSSIERIERQLDALQKDDALFLCGTNNYDTFEDGTVYGESNYLLDYNEIKNILPDSFPICCATMFFRRELLDTIGGYPDFFSTHNVSSADYYWYSKIVEKYKVINLPFTLYFYRHVKGSFSNKVQISNSKQFYALDLIKRIIEIRKYSGIDILEDNSIELTNLIKTFEDPFIRDPLLVEKKNIERAFYYRDYGLMRSLIIKVLYKNPRQSMNFYFRILKLLYRSFFRSDQ